MLPVPLIEIKWMLPFYEYDTIFQELVDDSPAGAAGGQPPNDLRQGVGLLMDAMRDLLNNIQPVPPPVEGDGNNNQDNGEDLPQEEWD